MQRPSIAVILHVLRAVVRSLRAIGSFMHRRFNDRDFCGSSILFVVGDGDICADCHYVDMAEGIDQAELCELAGDMPASSWP